MFFQEMRQNRCIVLTTHFMEEADILGDRIAMMASGRIKCCGTPLFLKKYYGTGYTLKLTTSGGEGGNKEILDVVQSFIPRANMENDNSNSNSKNNQQSEITICLPNDDKTLEIFPNLFSKLNEDKEPLGIITVGLSLST